MVLLRLRSAKKSPFVVIPQQEGRQHGHPEISTGNYSTSRPFFFIEHLFLMENREAMKILSPPPGRREVLLALLLPNT